MPRATDRQLIEAAVAVLANGPATANQISVEIRTTHKLPNDHRHIKNLLVVAAAENVVAPAPRNKGCRSETWKIGSNSLPDWLFVRERPAVEPEPKFNVVTQTVTGKAPAEWRAFTHDDIARYYYAIDDRLARIEAAVADLAGASRPLFARRNGH